MLSQLSIINWIDFHAWRKDYEIQQIYEMYQLIKKEHGDKGLEMIVGLMKDD